ncbi:MAG: hypothetical protein JRN20_07105 [Nitrososphaerota archaeon]|nr:hypothetical protein [Nitrososphaerota archaeon]
MQLAITKLVQVPPISSTTATIQVSFEIAGDLPSFVQIYAAMAGTGVSTAPLVNLVPIKSGVYQYNDIPFAVKPPGVTFIIYVCPRTGPQNLPDNMIDGVEWDSYCATAYITPKGQQASPPETLSPPSISAFVPHPANMNQPNRITVTWASSTSYDKYVLGWIDVGYQTDPNAVNYGSILQNPPWELPNQAQDINQKGTSGSYDVPTQPGHLYIFHVNGGISQFWNYRYSPWGPPAAQIAIPNSRSLRTYLLDSGINPAGCSMRSLLSSGQTVRTFMQI